ncbi:MAG: DUF4145 domain-containing protein, partial [Pseudomonadota bacterium]
STPHKTVGVVNKKWRSWSAFSCTSCGGIVVAFSDRIDGHIFAQQYFPPPDTSIPSNLPDRAAQKLSEAMRIGKQSAAATRMLCASSIDFMLKAHELREGSLYARIKQAADQHLITQAMANWAHEVRLASNEDRHADEDVDPTPEQAEQCLALADAFGRYLFTLPAMVEEGRKLRDV